MARVFVVYLSDTKHAVAALTRQSETEPTKEEVVGAGVPLRFNATGDPIRLMIGVDHLAVAAVQGGFQLAEIRNYAVNQGALSGPLATPPAVTLAADGVSIPVTPQLNPKRKVLVLYQRVGSPVTETPQQTALPEYGGDALKIPVTLQSGDEVLTLIEGFAPDFKRFP